MLPRNGGANGVTSSGTAQWDPDQYERFKAERARPFWDLVALVQPCPGGRVVDLGCGTGELTKELHRFLGASEKTVQLLGELAGAAAEIDDPTAGARLHEGHEVPERSRSFGLEAFVLIRVPLRRA